MLFWVCEKRTRDSHKRWLRVGHCQSIYFFFFFLLLPLLPPLFFLFFPESSLRRAVFDCLPSRLLSSKRQTSKHVVREPVFAMASSVYSGMVSTFKTGSERSQTCTNPFVRTEMTVPSSTFSIERIRSLHLHLV